MSKSNFHVKSQGPVLVIELPDRSFAAFTDALKQCGKTYSQEKVLMMQSVDKEGEVFKIVIVFQF